MKKLYLIFFLVLSAALVSAQQIQNVRTYPANPTENDIVYLIVDASFPSGGCELMNFTSNVSGSMVTVELYHCLGPLTFICNASDTINLGQLPPGTYMAQTSLYSSVGNITCTTYSLGGTDNTSFIVDFASSIKSDFLVKPLVTVSGQLLKIEKAPLNSLLTVTDLSGKQILNQPLGEGNAQVALPDLNGIYFFRIATPDGRSATGKFVTVD